MSGLLDWLGTLPDALLYCTIVLAAFAENVFPPLPADTVVALGAFTAARGNGTAAGAWAATMIGNVSGAMFMYFLGKRFGLPWLARWFPALKDDTATLRFKAHYLHYGLPGIALSRFLPGVRAVVPPVAGTLSLPIGRVLIAMTTGSAVWYGIVCWVAFHAGANAEAVLAQLSKHLKTLTWIAGVIILIGVTTALFVRRSRLRAKE